MKVLPCLLGLGCPLTASTFLIPLTQEAKAASKPRADKMKAFREKYDSLEARRIAAYKKWRNGGSPAEAERSFRKIIEEGYTLSAGLDLVRVLKAQGKYEEARKQLALYVHPDMDANTPAHFPSSVSRDPKTLVEYAELCVLSENSEEAAWALSLAGATPYQAYMRAAHAAEVAGAYEDEERFYREALKRKPNDQAAKRGINAAREHQREWGQKKVDPSSS